MALSLRPHLPWRRQSRIQPMAAPWRDAGAPPVARVEADPTLPRSDDYLVEGSEQARQPSAMLQVAQFFQVVLILFMAVLSFAIFWMLGMLFNIL